MKAERTAEWRIVPREERAVVAERRRWRHRRRAFQGLVVAPFFLGSLVLLGIVNGVLPALVLGVFALGLVGFGTYALFLSARTVAGAASYRETLKEAHRAVGGLSVELTVIQGAAPTGYDHGVVWIEGGRFFFVGARTSFGLFATNLAPGARATLATAGDAPSVALPLERSTAVGRVSLDLSPLEPSERAAAELGWLVRTWLGQASAGEGQLPPLAIGPDAPTPRYLLARAVGVTLLWATGLPLAWGLVTVSAFGVWTAPLVIPLVVGAARLAWREFGDPLDRWQAWRDRRRLG